MEELLTISRMPELRRMLLLAALLLVVSLAIYRIGYHVPPSIVNQAQVQGEVFARG